LTLKKEHRTTHGWLSTSHHGGQDRPWGIYGVCCRKWQFGRFVTHNHSTIAQLSVIYLSPTLCSV